MRVLFVTSTRIGDAVLSSGVLARLVETLPEARFTIVCGAPTATLFSAVPRLERLIPVTKARFKGHWLSVWRACVLKPWHVVIDLRSSGLAYFLPAHKRRIYTKPRQHEHRVLSFSRVLGSPVPLDPQLFAGAAARATAQRLVPEAGKALALGPAANWIGKQWPVERFAALARALTAPGAPFAEAPILVLGAPGERSSIAALFEVIPKARCIDLVGRVDLLEAYACLERARLYIGNDSGLMHIAAAAGTPTLGLFGPTDDSLYGPWGSKTAVVRGKAYRDIVEAPGYDWRDGRCFMGELTVEAVLRAALALVSRTSPLPTAAS